MQTGCSKNIKEGRKECCVIIGSSGGLGTALVEEFLRAEYCRVLGVARTELEQLPSHRQWAVSQRYRHCTIDIGQPGAVGELRELARTLPSEPLLVIFNAACLKEEVKEDLTLDYKVFQEINRVGVIGLGHILEAFESHFLKYGGVFTGISSINALMPSVLEGRVAYSASKAYLHMGLRSLELVWGNKIRTVTFHLGHIGRSREGFFFKLVKTPTYPEAAKMIVKTLSRRRLPREITYPFLYRIGYSWIPKMVPDGIYCKILKFLVNPREKMNIFQG